MMKQIRRILCVFFALILLAGLSVPILAAEITRSKLRNTCNALDMYLYPMIYQDVDGYDGFSAELNEAKAVLGNQDSTDQDVQNAYYKLRDAYVKLMMNAFDFSGLERIANMEDWLNRDLYKSDGMEELLAKLALCRTQLEAPNLYEINDRSAAEYVAYVQEQLDRLEDDAAQCYNALRFKELPARFTLLELQSLCRSACESVRAEAMSDLKGWLDLTEAMTAARTVINDSERTEEDIQAAASELLSSYDAFIRHNFDLSTVQNYVSEAKSKDPTLYTALSYDAYRKAIDELTEALSRPLFLYLPSHVANDGVRDYIQNALDALGQNAKDASDELVPSERVEYLASLCSRYEHITPIQELSGFQSALELAVQNGLSLLGRENFTSTELESAISAIEGSSEQLIAAAEALDREESSKVSTQVTRIRLILAFTVVTLILSIGSAALLSFRQFGKIDWTR